MSETIEVTVSGQNFEYALLATQCDDLSIENQIPASIGVGQHGGQVMNKLVSWKRDTATRTAK